jgi:hypothetical protein
MRLKKLAAITVLMGSCALIGTSANAAPVIQDGWQIALPDGTVTNIGHLVVSGGQSTITQQLDAAGNILVGSRFTNFGGLFSITYTPENCPGACDSGSPGILPNLLEYEFSGLSGIVTDIDASGAVSFAFDAGVGSASLLVGGSEFATFSPRDPSGGSLANFFGEANTSGTSNLLFALTSSTPGLFKGTGGSNIQNVHFAIDTTNQIFGTGASDPFACDTFGAGGFCSTLVVTQQGKIDMLAEPAQIPEPGILALLGLGVLGIGAVRRRKV